MINWEVAKKYRRVLDLIDRNDFNRDDIYEAFNNYVNSLDFVDKKIDALNEENAALRAAVKEMARMLSVLKNLDTTIDITMLKTYRQTPETALAKMEAKHNQNLTT